MAERFVDRQSAYPNRYKVTRSDGTTEYITLERADEPTVMGTPLNAATFNSMLRRSCPVNLLDNSDFRNPVNQRGFVSGTEGTANYTIDRWKLQYSTLMGLESDSISLWGHWGLWQPINRKIRAGEKYTLAVECKGETGNERFELQMQSGTFGVQFKHTENNIGTDWKTIAAVFTVYQDLPIGDCSFDITLFSNDGQPTKTFIRWAAFYEGEYTADTLPEYQPKGYDAELLACQRELTVLTFNQYGDALPAAGIPGRIFFKKVTE